MDFGGTDFETAGGGIGGEVFVVEEGAGIAVEFVEGAGADLEVLEGGMVEEEGRLVCEVVVFDDPFAASAL